MTILGAAATNFSQFDAITITITTSPDKIRCNNATVISARVLTCVVGPGVGVGQLVVAVDGDQNTTIGFNYQGKKYFFLLWC